MFRSITVIPAFLLAAGLVATEAPMPDFQPTIEPGMTKLTATALALFEQG